MGAQFGWIAAACTVTYKVFSFSKMRLSFKCALQNMENKRKRDALVSVADAHYPIQLTNNTRV